MKLKLKLPALIGLVIIMTNCTVQKRMHRKGYYIDWNKKSTNSVSEKTVVKEDFVASADDKINLSKKEVFQFDSQPLAICEDKLFLIYEKSELKSSASSKHIASNTSSNIQATPCNDTLIFKDGKIIACEIVEVKSDYIKYKKCDSLNKAEYYIERYKVKRFVNLTEIIEPKPLKNESSPKKTPSPYSAAAFLSSLLAIVLFLVGMTSGGAFSLFFAIILFLLAIILGIIGLVQINNNREIYNGKVFSILAFVLPVVTFFGLILLIVLFFGF